MKCTTHISSNENGLEEISHERDVTAMEYFRRVIAARSFNVSLEHKETWEFKNGDWINKVTHECADHEKVIELMYLRRGMRSVFKNN